MIIIHEFTWLNIKFHCKKLKNFLLKTKKAGSKPALKLLIENNFFYFCSSFIVTDSSVVTLVSSLLVRSTFLSYSYLA